MPCGTNDIINVAIHWLAVPGMPPLALPNDYSSISQLISLPNEANRGLIEVLRLNTGLSFLWNVRPSVAPQAKNFVPFAHVTAEITQPVLVIQTVHAGQAIINTHSDRVESHIDGGVASFQLVRDVDFTLLLSDDANTEITTFIISESSLVNILGEGVARAFLTAANLTDISSSCTLRIPKHISCVLQSSPPDGLDQNMRKLFAQACALEYLCLLAAHVAGDACAPNTSQRERQVRALYEELLEIEGKLPPLMELAKRYGMSVKTLNDNFRRMFGSTIGAYMAAHRLNDAHAALEETDIPMKVLAARSGYSHVNNFINAFKHKFGYSPGSLRK